ncbi:MAG: hypothetical protein CMP75_04455 [Flavobacteriales bacterium]|nr:hypothetical protein [Flavobacteriales bacterium]
MTRKMKKSGIMTYAFIAMLLSFTSCSDDHDHGCEECHIAWIPVGSTVEVQGELGEFCDDALEDVEANGYNLAEQIILGTDTIPAGQYAAGDVHCGEHSH